MLVRFLSFFLLVCCGCKSTHVNQGKVIPHDEYEHYYVVKDEGTDKDIQEQVVSFTDKVKNVFKKDPPVQTKNTVKPKTIESKKPKQEVKPIQLPKRRVRDTQPITDLPIVVNETKLMPMTSEQVKIVDLKNNVITTLAYIQAFLIIFLTGVIVYVFRKKNKTKKEINNDKVLKL